MIVPQNIWTQKSGNCGSVLTFYLKPLLKTSGAPQTVGDPRTGLCNPEKIWVTGAVFCLIRGSVRDPGNGLGQERGSFRSVRIFFYGPGLDFIGSEMIYIIIIPLSKFDINIKGAAHPEMIPYHVNNRVNYAVIDPVQCHLGSLAAWSKRIVSAPSAYADAKRLHCFGAIYCICKICFMV